MHKHVTVVISTTGSMQEQDEINRPNMSLMQHITPVHEEQSTNNQLSAPEQVNQLFKSSLLALKVYIILFR